MMIYLNTSQADIIQLALENYQRQILTSLNEAESDSVKNLINTSLFELDLLVTWFDRQKELRS